MWAAGVVDLGLAAEYLWSLTPAEYERLFEKHLAREDRANRRAAMITCMIANMAGKQRTSDKPLVIEDLLPYHNGHIEPGGNYELEKFRREADTSIERFVERVRAGNPTTDVTFGKAVIDAAAHGLGRWDKLGTREGLMQPVAVIKAMNPGWRNK